MQKQLDHRWGVPPAAKSPPEHPPGASSSGRRLVDRVAKNAAAEGKPGSDLDITSAAPTFQSKHTSIGSHEVHSDAPKALPAPPPTPPSDSK